MTPSWTRTWDKFEGKSIGDERDLNLKIICKGLHILCNWGVRAKDTKQMFPAEYVVSQHHKVYTAVNTLAEVFSRPLFSPCGLCRLLFYSLTLPKYALTAE